MFSWKTIPVAVLWFIWKQRYGNIFNGTQPDLVELCEVIKLRAAAMNQLTQTVVLHEDPSSDVVACCCIELEMLPIAVLLPAAVCHRGVLKCLLLDCFGGLQQRGFLLNCVGSALFCCCGYFNSARGDCCHCLILRNVFCCGFGFLQSLGGLVQRLVFFLPRSR